MASRAYFWRLSRPRHDAHLGHSLAPEAGSRSAIGGRPSIETLARSFGLWRQSVGLSLR
jgi:hypothetical protein